MFCFVHRPKVFLSSTKIIQVSSRFVKKKPGINGPLLGKTRFYIYQWRRKVPKSVRVCARARVCVCGGGGGGGGGLGHTCTYIYVPSVKNQYKRDVVGYMVIYVTAICVSVLTFSTR